MISVFDNNRNSIKQANSFFNNIKKSFGLNKEILSDIPSDIITMISEIDNVILSLDKVDKYIESLNISNTELVNMITKSEALEVNKYFNKLLKLIMKNKNATDIYHKKGFIKTIRYILSQWNNILLNANEEFTDLSDKLSNSESKVSDINLSTILYINLYSTTPMVEYFGREVFDLLCIILSTKVFDKDNNSYLNRKAKILSLHLNVQSIVFTIVFDNNRNIVKNINKNIKKRGIDYPVFSNNHNLFNFIKISDFTTSLFNLFRLSRVSKSIIGGDFYINRKIKKIEKLNDKKEYMQMRILYLKSQKMNSTNEVELEKIQNSIDYYEAKIQIIDKQLNDLYS